jgi:hypothetical protein
LTVGKHFKERPWPKEAEPISITSLFKDAAEIEAQFGLGQHKPDGGEPTVEEIGQAFADREARPAEIGPVCGLREHVVEALDIRPTEPRLMINQYKGRILLNEVCAPPPDGLTAEELEWWHATTFEFQKGEITFEEMGARLWAFIHRRTRERAYYLWLEAGSPEGRDLEFWAQAEAEQE